MTCAHEDIAILILMVLALALLLGGMAAVIVWASRRADRAGRRQYQRHLYTPKKGGVA